MNAIKMQSIERGLNGTARKVLEAVGWGDERTVHEITQRLTRCGYTYTVSAIVGSLKGMEEQGLLRNRGELWLRVRPSGMTPQPKVSPPAPASAPPPPVTTQLEAVPIDPVLRLAELAKTLRSSSSTMAAAASTIEEIALQLEERLGAESEELIKLRQLRDMLKGL
jgi:hypothetical protein